MLNFEQRIYLVKNVDCYALSDARKNALRSYFAIYGLPSDSDVLDISNLTYLQEKNIRDIAIAAIKDHPIIIS